MVTKVRKDVPAQVQITYTIETGETKYMMFSRDVKSPDVLTGARNPVSNHEDDPRECIIARLPGILVSWSAQEMDGHPVVPCADKALESEALI